MSKVFTHWTALPERPHYRGEIVCVVVRHTSTSLPVAYLWRVSAVSRDLLTVRGVERTRNDGPCAVDRLSKQPVTVYRIGPRDKQRAAADLFEAGFDSFNGGAEAAKAAIMKASAERVAA